MDHLDHLDLGDQWEKSNIFMELCLRLMGSGIFNDFEIIVV